MPKFYPGSAEPRPAVIAELGWTSLLLDQDLLRAYRFKKYVFLRVGHTRKGIQFIHGFRNCAASVAPQYVDPVVCCLHTLVFAERVARRDIAIVVGCREGIRSSRNADIGRRQREWRTADLHGFVHAEGLVIFLQSGQAQIEAAVRVLGVVRDTHGFTVFAKGDAWMYVVRIACGIHLDRFREFPLQKGTRMEPGNDRRGRDTLWPGRLLPPVSWGQFEES